MLLASTHIIDPTPYEDVNTILNLLFTKMQAVLASRLVGLYLYGSLSLGDFDPASSDVDFLAVTTEELSEAMLEQLRAMHAAIAASGLPYANKLEGSYMPLQALQRYNPDNARHPAISTDAPFQVEFHGENWIIERYSLREHGVVIYGPTLVTLIDPVTLQDVQTALYTHLKNFWQFQLDQPEWLRGRDYQAFAILTLCRALYTLQRGVVSSKPQAAAWASEAYPHWRPLIERSLAWRTQHETADLTETLAFLREALTLALAIYE